LKQLQDNAKLLGEKVGADGKKDGTDRRVKRIEYIFSTYAAALANRENFRLTFNENEQMDNFDVFYMDDLGKKVRFTIKNK
jgi:hypothetical protein